MNLDMCAEVVASGGAVLERKKSKGRKRTRARGLEIESGKQRERTAFLHGIMAERLAAQPSGRYHCETCGTTYRTFDEAWEALTVSHIEARNDTASRYERRREPHFRGDDPANIVIECVPCNRKREPQPEWGAA